MNADRLDRADLGSLKHALNEAALPSTDIGEPGRTFFRFSDEGQEVGFGGLEGSGPDLLLRSVVVAPAMRGKGQGGRLLAELEKEAVAIGGRRLHLLTNTAAPFSARHGYERQGRETAPASIAGSAEFTRLCPASALYLVKRLPT